MQLEAAAPEVTGIEVVEAPAGPAVIPVSALRSRLDGAGVVARSGVAGA